VPAPPRPAAPKPQPVQLANDRLNDTPIFVVPSGVSPWRQFTCDRDRARWSQQAFKGFARILGRAFAPGAVITYAIGFIFFAVVPYFLVVTRTSAASAWLESLY